MAYNIIRLDKVKSNAHLYSIRATKDLEVGSIVKLGDLEVDGEVYKVTEPADIAKDDQLVMVVPTALQYEEPRVEEEYILKAGQVGRAYLLEKGDIITSLDGLFTGTTTIKEYAVPVNGSFKLAPATTLSGEMLGFKVIAKETMAGYPATVLEVIKRG